MVENGRHPGNPSQEKMAKIWHSMEKSKGFAIQITWTDVIATFSGEKMGNRMRYITILLT